MQATSVIGSQRTKRPAVQDGARIILGPVYAEAANAAGIAAAKRGVNVLAFSNNTSIAGGNVFVLGSTFENSARRLTQYAKRQGKSNMVVVSGNNAAGQTGRAPRAASAPGRAPRSVPTAPVGTPVVKGCATTTS